ncbi:MAG: recombination regulator RecX [Acidobacteriia bacterium]|nr:recombination regulator RecX [Terriglobia bacterium]
MQKAGSLLARRSYSRGELCTKLASFGEPLAIETVLDRLEQLNLLNDVDYAYNLASRWTRQDGWGPIKVRHLLMRRKVPGPVIEAAIDRVHHEISDTGALEAYLDRRGRTHPLPEDCKGIHKLILSLRRRGFPQEAIWSALRQKVRASVWQELDTGE